MLLLIHKEQLVTKRLNNPLALFKSSGFSLIEVILSAALFLIIATFVVPAYLYGQESVILSGERQRAALYAEEGLEALRNLRDANFNNLTVGGPYGLATSTGTWTINGTSDTNGEFTRQILISNVGANRLKATSTVTWNQNAQRSGVIDLVTYFTNWSKSGLGNWQLPIIETGYAFTPTVGAADVVISGDYAYVILVSGSPNFYIVNISSLTAPVVTGSATLVSNLSNLVVSGNYAYVTGTGNGSELQIIDVTNKNAPVLRGTFNANGNNDAYGVAISGNYVYFVRALSTNANQNEFEVVNVSNPALPTSAGVLNLEAATQDIHLVGNYAYIVSQDDVREFQIINISNPALPVRSATINLVGANTTTNGRAITTNTNGTLVFVSRMDGAVYPIDATSKTSPVLLAANGWSSVGSTQDMILFNNDQYLALANTLSSGELKIFDVTNPIAPTQISSLDISGTTSNFMPTGIDYSQTYDRLYLAGARFAGSSNRQLIIVKPQ